jgi:hypothetical protein
MHGSARCLPSLAAVSLVALVVAPGCTRHDFRERADRDVEGVITQKNIFPQWQLKNWHVYPDPRSRFADNTNPDRPPYPPDDFATRLVSPNPQRPTKKSGVGREDGTGYIPLLAQWDAENRAEDPRAPGHALNADGPAPDAVVAAVKGAGPVAGAAAPVKSGGWTGAPAIPAPTLLVGDRPAVRHALPSDVPAARRPASDTPSAAAAPPAQPALTAPPAAHPDVPDAQAPKLSAAEFGPWIAMPSNPPGPNDRSGSGVPPSIDPLRRPTVVVVAGEADPIGRPAVVPAVAAGSAPQPEKLPEPPAPAPLPAPAQFPPAQPAPAAQPPSVPLPPAPKEAAPKAPDPAQAAAGPTSSATQGLTGDPNLDPLSVLDSKLAGYRIKMEQALLLASINAREFQDRREDVYVAALDVTLTRFSFAAQGLFTEQAIRQSIGSQLTNAGQYWNFNTTTGVSKLFPTGAQLTAQLANQVTVDLGNGKPTVALSNLSLSLLQPFLSGGGYAVTLEPLTQNERNMVYALRSFERFRRLFYVSVSAGSPNGYTNNPYGLQGLSVNLGRGIGANLTSPSVGFLPLLQQQAVILNQRKNIAYLERLLKFYRAFAEGGQYSDLQVGQVEVLLLNSRAGLLGSANSTNNSTTGIRGFLDTLDNFKLQLGMPLTLNLELDDAPMRPIHRQLSKFEQVYAQVQAVELAASKYDRAEPVADFRKRWQRLFTASELVRGTPFAKSIEERWGSWDPAKLTNPQVLDRLVGLREERRKLLAARAERELRKVPEPPAEAARLTRLNSDIDLGEFELRVRAYEAQPWARLTGREREQVQSNAFSVAYNGFYQVILDARNDRLESVHRAWPELAPLQLGGSLDALSAPLDEAYTEAVRTALSNRLDLMNARGQLVDSWRQINVTANALQGVVNAQYNLNAGTKPGANQPFNFTGSETTSQLQFNFQLPLVRRAERNAYRTALISYQAARRTLLAFEDNIANDVRSDVRELRTIAQLYRIQQRVVEVQYAQVDNATAVLFAPPAPSSASNDQQTAAAALTQQVLNAQNNLVIAQNTLYQLWVAYLTSRMSFYLDLERLQLDDRGVWIDEYISRIQRNDQSDDADKPGPAGGGGGGERLHAPRPADGPGK